MTTKEIEVARKGGLEARPVAVFVQIASQYKSSIYVQYEDKKVNAKSIMGMMSLSLAKGEKITVSADGDDEEQALLGLEGYLLAKE